MHVHPGCRVGLRDGEHVAPVAALAVNVQRRRIVLRGRVVMLELEVRQGRQRVQFSIGPCGEIGFQQREGAFVFAPFQGFQHLVGSHTELLAWQTNSTMETTRVR